MRTKLTVVTALAGSLLATCLVSESAKAMSVPVLRGGATPGIVTLVGRGGGRGGVGRVGVGRGVRCRASLWRCRCRASLWRCRCRALRRRCWCPALRCRCWCRALLWRTLLPWRISLLERRGLRRQPRILVREPPVREPWVREPRVREPWVREPWVREPRVRAPRALALVASRREGPILHRLSDDYRWEEWSPRDTGRNLLSRRALLNPSRLIDAKEMSALGH